MVIDCDSDSWTISRFSFGLSEWQKSEWYTVGMIKWLATMLTLRNLWLTNFLYDKWKLNYIQRIMFHSTLLCSVHHFRRNSIFLLLWDFLRLRKHEIKKYLSMFLLTNKSIWWYILCNKNYKSLKKKKHVQAYLVKHRKYANTANLHILDAKQ